MRGIWIGIAVVMAAGCGKDDGPPADCQKVGRYAASFELGNYAPVEKRAPTEAKFVAKCREAGVSEKQGACVVAAKDVWTAAACAPKLFPDVKVSGDCGQIAGRVREALGRTMGSGGDAEMTKMMEKVSVVIHDSCEQDGWPAPFKACILDAKDVVHDLDKCEKLMPAELKSKLDARMSAAVKGP